MKMITLVHTLKRS